MNSLILPWRKEQERLLRCACCGNPTRIEYDSRPLCLEHFFQEVSLDEYVKARQRHEEGPGTPRSPFHLSEQDGMLDRYFEYALKEWAFRNICKGDARPLEDRAARFELLRAFILGAFERRYFGYGNRRPMPQFETVTQLQAGNWIRAIKGSHEYRELFAEALLGA